MALTPSNMLPLGSTATDFSLINSNDDSLFSLKDSKESNAYLIFFICNHCPYVKHIQQQLLSLYADYNGKKVSFIAINSNDYEQYIEDSPAKMKAENYPFPYLIDETQQIAKAYMAACTPDFYLFNSEKKLVYRGQLDDARPGNDKPNDGKSLREALDNLLAGKAISKFQKPSIGCNIKWK